MNTKKLFYPQVKAVLALNVATMLWALNFVLGRWLKMYISPLELSSLRYLIAFFGIIDKSGRVF